MSNISSRGSKTKNEILKTGLKMWKEDPQSVNAHAIGKRLGMVHGTVMYHFPYGVKNAVAEYAVDRRDPVVVSQLIVMGHGAADSLSPTERAEYLKSI